MFKKKKPTINKVKLSFKQDDVTEIISVVMPLSSCRVTAIAYVLLETLK